MTRVKAAGPSPFPAYLSQANEIVSATIANTGNLLLSPRAHVVVKGLFGTLFDATVQITDLIPGQSSDLSEVWKHVPPFEIGSVRVDVRDDSASPAVAASASASVVAIPWNSLLALILALTAIFGGRWYLRRDRASRGRLRGGRRGIGSMRTRSSVSTKTGS